MASWRLRAFDALLGGPTRFLVGDGSHAKSCDMNQHVIQDEGAMEPTCVSKLDRESRTPPYRSTILVVQLQPFSFSMAMGCEFRQMLAANFDG